MEAVNYIDAVVTQELINLRYNMEQTFQSISKTVKKLLKFVDYSEFIKKKDN